ncbi:MAG: DnaB-like helicase C-terminal domain-containing protein [Hyphomicrobiaceae bacterium]|nr:AAA family ATPase [Hyphomicrobiaceae bacterium]
MSTTSLKQRRVNFDDPQRERAEYTRSQEIAILGKILMQPSLIGEIKSRLPLEMMTSQITYNLLAAVYGLYDEGRQPSIEGVLSRMPGGADAEIEPGVTQRTWMVSLIGRSKDYLFMPWLDVLETLLDVRTRDMLQAIGSNLSAGSQGQISTLELIQTAVGGLDTASTFIRPRGRLTYTVGGAASALLERLDRNEALNWPTTGFTDFDTVLGGWPRGQLSIVAGRPGMGKSAFVTSSLLRGVRKSKFVDPDTGELVPQNALMFSLEMNKEQLGARVLCDLAYIRAHPIMVDQVINGKIDTRERERLEDANVKLKDMPVLIDEQPGLTISEIEARSRKHFADLKRKGKRLDVVVVDHIGLIRADFKAGFNRASQLHEITVALMAMAKELDCAVVGLSQLNRGVEGRDNKRPDLSDLRESGNIEENASVVAFLYRPAYYLAKQKHDDHDLENDRLEMLARVENDLEMIVSKNRNGRVGVQTLFCAVGSNAVRDKNFGG